MGYGDVYDGDCLRDYSAVEGFGADGEGGVSGVKTETFRQKRAYDKTMATNTVQISLPDPLKDYLEERVAEGEFGTPGEYIRNLIREDRERRTKRLEAQLLEALESKRLEITQEEWQGKTLTAVLRAKLASL